MSKPINDLHIAVIGLALSHPYTFIDILLGKGILNIHVWDDQSERLEALGERYEQASLYRSFNDLLEKPLDGAIICTESHLHPQFTIPMLEKGVPTFVDKVMAISPEHLEQLEKAEAVSGTPLFSSSILRFSPEFIHLKKRVESSDINTCLSATATVFHSIEGYLKKGNTWQDEKDKGGGTLINMGVHGVELLYTLFGPGVSKVWAHTSKRYYYQSQSEDTAILHLKYHNGMMATVQLICGTKHHGYGIEVFMHEHKEEAFVPYQGETSPLIQYGYDGAMEVFVKMVQMNESPIPFVETVEIMRVLLAARTSSEKGEWVII